MEWWGVWVSQWFRISQVRIVENLTRGGKVAITKFFRSGKEKVYKVIDTSDVKQEVPEGFR